MTIREELTSHQEDFHLLCQHWTLSTSQSPRNCHRLQSAALSGSIYPTGHNGPESPYTNLRRVCICGLVFWRNLKTLLGTRTQHTLIYPSLYPPSISPTITPPPYPAQPPRLHPIPTPAPTSLFQHEADLKETDNNQQ